MTLALTTDVHMDQFVAGALEPIKQEPFEERFARAQVVLTAMSASLFFRRFVAEKIAELGEGRDFIRIARDARTPGAEWLVLTHDYQLKFWLFGSGSLYDLGEISHSTFLKAKANSRLGEMQSYMPAMRYLISRFGTPSFTVEDIRAEAQRNGNVNVIVISASPNAHKSLAASLSDRLLSLQTTSTNRVIFLTIFPEMIGGLVDIIAERSPNNDNHLFVLDLAPEAVLEVNALFAMLPPVIRKRLWVIGDKTYDKTLGFDPAFMDMPLYDEAIRLPNEQLLALLNTMFYS